MRKIGVGLIGAGFAANLHVSAYKKLPNVEVVGVYSRTADRARRFAGDHGLKRWCTDVEELVKWSDLDAVSVVVPNYLHARLALEAIEHGKSVIVEKPLATSIQDAEEVVKAAARQKVKLM